MVRIEPVGLHVTGDSQDLNPEKFDLTIGHWNNETTWVLNKLIDDSYNIVNQQTIQTAVENSTKEVFDNLTDSSHRIVEDIAQRTAITASRAAGEAPVVLSKKEAIIFLSPLTGYLEVLHDDQDIINELKDEWGTKMEDLSVMAEDFGINVGKPLSGQELVEHQIDNIDGEPIENEDDETEIEDLEKQVTGSVEENISSCFDSNVELQFSGDIYADSFEFDILLFPSPDLLIMIEVKDAIYDNDLDKSDLIRKQQEKLELLKDKARVERAHGFVVTREMDEDKFQQFARMAERRDIELIRYNDGNFVSEVSNVALQHVTEGAASQEPSAAFYGRRRRN